VFNTVAVEITGSMSGRIALGCVLQFTIGILKDDILVKFDQVRILAAAVRIVAGETGGAALPSQPTFNVQ
jgi:hypothetical protein